MKILRSEFSKGVAWLTSGTAAIQLLTIVFSPIITRLYLPEELGVFALYSSFLGVLLILGTLKYENSIPISSSNRMALNALMVSVFCLVFFSVFIAVFSWLVGDSILFWLDAEVLIKYKYLLPIGLFFSGSYLIVIQWGLRQKMFKKITQTKITQGVGMNFAQAGLGFLSFGSVGLIVGHIIGKSAGVFTLFRDLYTNFKDELKSVSIKRMRWTLYRFRKFPIFTMPAQLLSTLGIELPVFFITAFYGSDVVGQYALAHMIVGLPVTLIGTAVGDVFYAEAAQNGKSNPKALLRLTNKILKPLFFVGLIPMLVIVLFGPFLFPFVFGDNWIDAGEFAQIITIVAFARLLFTPVFWVFIVFEKHITYLLINVMRVAMVLISFLLVYFFDVNAFYAVAFYSTSMALVYLITYFMARNLMLKEIVLKEK